MLSITDVYAQRRHSKVPSQTPDKNQFPLYYQARNISVTLQPGDILYIPYGWWHFITSEKVDAITKMNIAISNWTQIKKCDCEISYDPIKYRIQCPSYNYDPDKVKKLLNTHTRLSMPFISHSKLHLNYNLDYQTLQNNLPEKIPIFHSRTNFFTSMHINYYHHNECYKDLFSFDEFYDMGLAGEHVYLGQFPIKDSSFNIAPISDNYTDTFLWVNFGNATSNLHYDTEDNLIMQVQGTKKITLFPPSERDNLYPYNPYPPGFMCYLVSKIKE